MNQIKSSTEQEYQSKVLRLSQEFLMNFGSYDCHFTQILPNTDLISQLLMEAGVFSDLTSLSTLAAENNLDYEISYKLNSDARQCLRKSRKFKCKKFERTMRLLSITGDQTTELFITTKIKTIFCKILNELMKRERNIYRIQSVV